MACGPGQIIAGPSRLRVSRETGPLFTDAEVAENDVQHVLDVDPAGQPAERLPGHSQFLGDDILAAGPRTLPHAAPQRGLGILQRAALTPAGHQSWLPGADE